MLIVAFHKFWISIILSHSIYKVMMMNIIIKEFTFQNSEGLSISGKYVSFPQNQDQKICDQESLDIILIHAFPFDSDMYVPNIEKDLFIKELTAFTMNRRRVRFFLPDLPGFGKSENFYLRPKNMEPYTEIIFEIGQKFRSNNLILGGCSMGGYITLEYANEHSEMLLGMILIDTRQTADNEEQRNNRYRTIKKIHDILISQKLDKSSTIRLGDLSDKDERIFAYLNGMHEKIISKTITMKKPLISKKIFNMMKNQTPKGVIHALNAMAGRKDTSLQKF